MKAPRGYREHQVLSVLSDAPLTVAQIQVRLAEPSRYPIPGLGFQYAERLSPSTIRAALVRLEAQHRVVSTGSPAKGGYRYRQATAADYEERRERKALRERKERVAAEVRSRLGLPTPESSDDDPILLHVRNAPTMVALDIDLVEQLLGHARNAQ